VLEKKVAKTAAPYAKKKTGKQAKPASKKVTKNEQAKSVLFEKNHVILVLVMIFNLKEI